MTITAIRSQTPAPCAQWHRPLRGSVDAPIVVVCDPPTTDAIKAGLPMAAASFKVFAEAAFANGMVKEDFLFVALCPPMPKNIINSDSKRWKHVEPHVEGVWERIRATNPKCVIPFGKEAARTITGRPVAITKARGKAFRGEGHIVLPMLSPAMVLRVPDHHPTFVTDIQTLGRLKQDGYELVERVEAAIDYQWCEDLSELIALHPGAIAVDTETTGLRWYDPSVEVITVQITYAPGKALVCPVDPVYWPEWNERPSDHRRLLAQLKTLLEDPNISKLTFNGKFDLHMIRKLGIEVSNWEDVQLKAWAVDENMLEKSLDECTRRWVPELAGANDTNNQSIDKSDMRAVPRDQFLQYSGTDTDMTFRLAEVLDDLLARDPQQERVYRLVKMPALRTFCDVVERHGMLIDEDRLHEFGEEVRAFLRDAYPSLIARVPAPVRRKHLEAGKELSFSRPDFTRDVLFSPEGFNLEPVVWTKGTRDEDEAHLKVASTSSKDHLPFFADPATPVGQFVLDLIDFQKTTKLEGSFIGQRDQGNGMWQYIAPNHRIYPSYHLHRTTTGRSSSTEPNGQNAPKRGRWAKKYQGIFLPTPGFKLVNCDLSQIELRLVAWRANDAAMRQVYRSGGDIHTTTAKYVSGLSDEQWNALSSAERKLLRFKAKACNFGFIYGLGARKFRAYAKTDYNVDMTEQESYRVRESFFNLYSALLPWHDKERQFVRNHGYVRSFHGAVRHLPSIWSIDEKVRAEAERQAINSPIQAFASDLGLMAMARFAAQADPELFRIIGFVHDALVMEVRDGYEQEGIEALLYAMQSNPLERCFNIRPPLPIIAEADIGISGGQMLEFADLPPVEERPEWFQRMGFDSVTARAPDWWNIAADEQWAETHLTN